MVCRGLVVLGELFLKKLTLKLKITNRFIDVIILLTGLQRKFINFTFRKLKYCILQTYIFKISTK